MTTVLPPSCSGPRAAAISVPSREPSGQLSGAPTCSIVTPQGGSAGVAGVAMAQTRWTSPSSVYQEVSRVPAPRKPTPPPPEKPFVLPSADTPTEYEVPLKSSSTSSSWQPANG